MSRSLNADTCVANSGFVSFFVTVTLEGRSAVGDSSEGGVMIEGREAFCDDDTSVLMTIVVKEK